MKKTEIVKMIAARTGLSAVKAGAVFDETFAVLGNALAEKGKITVTGFGAFSVRSRAARSGRNPQTGEAIRIGPSKTVAFKASKNLKNTVK